MPIPASGGEGVRGRMPHEGSTSMLAVLQGCDSHDGALKTPITLFAVSGYAGRGLSDQCHALGSHSLFPRRQFGSVVPLFKGRRVGSDG